MGSEQQEKSVSVRELENFFLNGIEYLESEFEANGYDHITLSREYSAIIS